MDKVTRVMINMQKEVYGLAEEMCASIANRAESYLEDNGVVVVTKGALEHLKRIEKHYYAILDEGEDVALNNEY